MSYKILWIAVSLGLSGCSFLAAQPDASRFFTLAAVATPGGAAGASDGMSFGLGPITLPGYLDRNQVAIRRSPTELSYSTTDRWAEPLSISVSRVLLQNLSTLLQTERIAPYPWSGAKIDYQIQVDLQRFESANTESILEARWIISDARSSQQRVLRTSRHSHPIDQASGEAISAALSADLASLSEEIAAELRSLPNP